MSSLSLLVCCSISRTGQRGEGIKNDQGSKDEIREKGPWAHRGFLVVDDSTSSDWLWTSVTKEGKYKQRERMKSEKGKEREREREKERERVYSPKASPIAPAVDRWLPIERGPFEERHPMLQSSRGGAERTRERWGRASE